MEIKARSLTVKRTHAKLTVEPADSASAFGWQPYIIVADEEAQWPSTRNSERLWEAACRSGPTAPMGSTLGLPRPAGRRAVDHVPVAGL